MTLNEFKAWFEGFTESMGGTPNAKQWKRIQKRVGEIDGSPITERVYIDRYIEPFRQHWPRPYWNTTPAVPFPGQPIWCSTSAGVQMNGDVTQFSSGSESDITTDMFAAGRIEAQVMGDGGSAG